MLGQVLHEMVTCYNYPSRGLTLTITYLINSFSKKSCWYLVVETELLLISCSQVDSCRVILIHASTYVQDTNNLTIIVVSHYYH